MPAAAGSDTASRAAAMLAVVRGGSGGLLVLIGEAGIGKTHAAERLLASAAPDCRTAWGTARPGAPVFWPWIEVLRSVCAPDLLGGSEDPGDLRARFELFDAVADALAADTKPLVVVLDDLHEADTASLLLLHHVVPMLRRAPILIVATTRPGRCDPAWADVVRASEVLPVAPLGANEVGAMLQDVTGDSPDPCAVHRILARTGGNALFVREVVKLVAADAAAVDALPETVRAVVAARVAQRSASCRGMLAVAAALGTSAPLHRLIAVFGESSSATATLIDEAAAHGLLAISDGDTVRFTHEIVRDAVYGNLPLAHRLHWHRQIATAMADQPASAASEVAEHLRRAGPEHAEEAGRWWERAGDESMSALAYEDAARYYERSLDGPGWAGVRLLRLGAARLAYGDAASARTAYLAAVDVGRRGGDPGLVAAAALGLGSGPAGFEVALQDREQIVAVQDALAMLPADATATRAALLARLSVALTFTAPPDHRARLAADALDLAVRSGDEAVLAVALASHCDVISGPGSVDERLAHTDRIVAIAERLRNSALELVGRRMRIVARLELGDMAGFADDARAFDIVAQAMRQPLYLWYRPMWQAMTALSEGRYDDCRAALAEAVRIGAEAGSENAFVLTSTLQWCLNAELGEVDAIAATVHIIEGIDAVWVSFSKALVYAQLGRIDDARAALDAAMRERDALPRDGNWLATVAQVAETLAKVGAHPIAEWVYDELTPYARLFVVEGIGAVLRGSVERHLGLAAAALGRHDTAAAHFERALHANRRLGAAALVNTTMADAQHSLGSRSKPEAARFARNGELWHLAFAGKEATVRDSKGLRDIARMLAHPGTPVPAIDLVTGTARGPAVREGLHQPGDLGDVIDERARQAYRRRLIELDEEAAAADSAGDRQRSAQIAAERDALLEQLSAAFGLGGRPRRAGSPVERARTTVTARIRDAIRRVEAVHPELGRHLRRSVRTGTVCAYEPETEVHWLTS